MIELKRQAPSDVEDEEAWLEALETGKLDEFDEFKRMKDPALMTARQVSHMTHSMKSIKV